MSLRKAMIVTFVSALGVYALGQQGQQLFGQNCAQCHGNQGQGGSGPALAGDGALGDTQHTVYQIVNGGGGMPPYGNQLSDQQIAAVASYIRTAWGNGYGKVTPQQVAGVKNAKKGSSGGAAKQAANQQAAGQQAAGQRSEAQSQRQSQQPNRASTQPVTSLQNASLGEQRFVEVCSACHGLQGKGAVGPDLAGNSSLKSAQYVVTTLLHGREVMPAFSLYPDRDLAAISSYIRSSWGNRYGAVKPAQVQKLRATLAASAQGNNQSSDSDSGDQ